MSNPQHEQIVVHNWVQTSTYKVIL